MNTKDAVELRQLSEASHWLVRLRDAPDDETLVNEWLRWCESDAGNVKAFERTRRLWRQVDQVVADAADPGAFLHERTPVRSRATGRTHRPDRRRRSFAAFAAVAACTTLVTFLWQLAPWQPHVPAPSAARENRTSILPDGSAVDLGARTSIAVDFTEESRLLRLSPGEAYFKVQPDPNRPFKVRTAELEVTAVGTAFDVNHQPMRTVVTVQEGVVAVRPLKHAASEPWHVASGHQFVYSESAGTTTLSSVDTSAVLAWREGRLEYTRTPLGAVLTDVNRYAQHPIEIEDDSIGELTFTGTVFTDSISDWVSALPGALPVDVRRTGDGKAVIRKRIVPAMEQSPDR